MFIKGIYSMWSNIHLERLENFTLYSCVLSFFLRVFSPMQLSVLEFTNCHINNVINHVPAMVTTLGHISCTEMRTACSILLPNFRVVSLLFFSVTLIFSWFHILCVCINPKHIRISFSCYFQSDIISEQNKPCLTSIEGTSSSLRDDVPLHLSWGNAY